ncbi:single-stranded DNA-binding protein [Staphylococcus simulans]|uniref:single-stranded DNA-binding protein n=1 Tax=Staphylococcus simulans TaxID=1286 RepID=UPI000D1E5EAE|nr:single-stranded DNA-binding protein [Staphylococcus simulans]PTI96344.1 hypothetical protein BU054_10895 [Staphylococcus simulans]RIN49991.1 single-stranded DNA-binding protein [Staphylococcus simulans]RIN56297.1 single-stranded DNA-binding protein [Staphylococcus simulans]RIN66062.1 single-stranded DNA-binding protein [Staphylococcus simulans]
MNLCVFTGRITKDLSIIESRSGTKVLPFDIAVSRKYKNQNGEYDTDFISCIAFKATAEFIEQYAKKGYLVTVKGEMRNNNFTRDDGTTNYGMQLVVDEIDATTLFSNKKLSDKQQDSYYNTNNTKLQYGQNNTNQKQSVNDNNPFANSNGPVDIQDDDLPF